MDRRSFLAAVAAVAGPLAGCTGDRSVGAPVAGRESAGDARRVSGADAGGTTTTPAALRTASPPTGTPAASGPPLVRRGTPPNVCDLPHVERGIAPVVDPAFGTDWSAVGPGDREPYGPLDDAVAVVAVERGGRSRAYPVPLLWYHEVVNDRFGGPLLVTYCPVCRSGVVAERTVGGVPTRFGVTGRRWRPPASMVRDSVADGRTFGVAERDASDAVAVRDLRNLVMYDAATDSYWSQVLARAVCGARRGDRLSVSPSTTTTFGEWRRATGGDGEVLLPPPHSGVGNP